MNKSKTIIAVGALSLLIMTSISTPSYSMKIKSNEVKAFGWTACLREDDSKTAKNDTHLACCSKEAGICIICPKTGGACDVVDHITRPDLLLRDKVINSGKSKLSSPSKSPAPGKVPNQKLSK